MKLNELNKIEEALFPGLRGMMSGQGKYQTQVQDIFIKDFVQDAITSLKNGFDGGLVHKEKNQTEPNKPATGSEPAAGTTPPAPSGGPSAPSAPQLTGPAAKPQLTGPGPVPRLPPPSSPTGTPLLPGPAPSGSGGAAAALPPPAASTNPKAKTTKMNYTRGPSQIPQHARVNKLSYNKLPPKPASQQTIQGKYKEVKEDTYNKMNRVFESIINIDEAEEGQMSISEYLMSWFEKYMQGVSWEPKRQLVKAKLDNIQQQYPTNFKANLYELGKLALSLSKTAIPAGAPPEFAQASKQGAAAGQASIQELKAALDDFAKTNPAGYNAFIKSLRPAQAS